NSAGVLNANAAVNERNPINPMKAIPGTLQEGGAGFQTAHWTLVLRARQTQSEISAQKALSNFSAAYWPPVAAGQGTAAFRPIDFHLPLGFYQSGTSRPRHE